MKIFTTLKTKNFKTGEVVENTLGTDRFWSLMDSLETKVFEKNTKRYDEIQKIEDLRDRFRELLDEEVDEYTEIVSFEIFK